MLDSETSQAFRELQSPRAYAGIPGGPRTVADVLARALAEHPDREFLVGRSKRVTYEEFDALAARAARAFADLGVQAGDRVAMSMPSDVDIVVGFHGLLRLGAVWLGVNRNLALPEKRYLLEDAGASLAVASPGMAEEFEAVRNDIAGLRQVVVCDAGAGDCEWTRLLAAATGAPPDVELHPHMPAGIAYTSGTTGRPKGVVHSHHNLLVPGAVQATLGGYTPEAVRGDCFPMTILNMQILTSLLIAQAGAKQVFMDRIDAPGVAAWVRDEGVTHLTSPTALLYSLAHDAEVLPSDLQSLERVLFGGGDCPQAIIDAFETKFGVPVQGTYGLTELPTAATMDRPGQHVRGASGVALPHLELSIRDGDDLALGPDEPGEVCIEATREGPWAGVYTPMLGYWRRPEATADALRGGRLHTGDIGLLGVDAALRIVDRKNLLIVRGGANVYPAEVERVLHADERVEACVVVGVPDERLGERVAAWVQRAPGATIEAQELLDRCAAQLARYKVPEHIEWIEAMPRNAMNKIARRELPVLHLELRSQRDKN